MAVRVEMNFLNLILLLIGLAVSAVLVITIIVVCICAIRKQSAPPQASTAPSPAEIPADTAGKSLAEKLKEARLARGMTQEFVAESLGVSRQAVSKWETGSADPSTGNLLALAKLYGVSAADLLE